MLVIDFDVVLIRLDIIDILIIVSDAEGDVNPPSKLSCSK
jgi:hypothetical protein